MAYDNPLIDPNLKRVPLLNVGGDAPITSDEVDINFWDNIQSGWRQKLASSDLANAMQRMTTPQDYDRIDYPELYPSRFSYETLEAEREGMASYMRGEPEGVPRELPSEELGHAALYGVSQGEALTKYGRYPEQKAQRAKAIQEAARRRYFDSLLPEYLQASQEGGELLRPGVHDITGAPSIPSGIGRAVKDPGSSAQLLAQSLGRGPEAIGFMVVGGLLAGPLGSALGGAAGGYSAERIGGIVNQLQIMGVDFTTEEGVDALIANPGIVKEADDKAGARAAAIGTVSGITGLVGGKLGQAALRAGLTPARRIATGLSTIPIGGTLEATGEGLAQVAADEPHQPGEIAVEGVLGAAIDAPVAATSTALNTYQQSQMDEMAVRAMLEKQAGKVPVDYVVEENLPSYQAALEARGVADADLADVRLAAQQEAEGAQRAVRFPGMSVRKDGKATSVFNFQDIYALLSNNGAIQPTRKAVKNMLKELVFEESTFHGSVPAYVRANQDALTKRQVDTLERLYGGYAERYNDDFDAWVTVNEDTYVRRDDGGAITNLPELQEEFTNDHLLAYRRNQSGFKRFLRAAINTITGTNGNVYDLSTSDLDGLLTQVEKAIRSGAIKVEGIEATLDTTTARSAKARGGLESPSRRKFLKQAGGAVAGAVVDPSIILEPATPTPPIAPPGFAGGIMRPGIAPEYESAMRAAEMASPSGLVSDVASEAFDDFDYEAAAREDQALADQLKAYEDEQPQREKVPQKWRELETPELQALMEENRTKGNAIWVAQNKELESRDVEPALQLTTEDRVTLEEAGEADALALSLDNIYSTFDSDYSVADAIVDGALDNLVRMEAQNSNFTRQELWDAVNARQEALEDMDTESVRRLEARFAKSKAEMSDAEILNRDVRNEATKKYRKAIRDSEISDEEKNDRSKLLKDLLRPWGAEGMNRGLIPGDRETFRRYAKMIVDGKLEAVSEFIQPFLDQIAAEKAPSKTKTAKRDYYAGYKGVSADELAEYRERGKTHPMEKKMTYPFADEEINRLEAGGEITANEAENRRRVAREFRSALQGKLPQTAKRKLTEIVYGIEDYADITPWTEKYTATEVEGMGERAEVAQAEARRTRYEKTKLTKTQEAEILEESITTEERAALAEMESNEQFDNLKTRKDRLLFLRNPSPMSQAERAELDAFLSDVKGFDQDKYKKSKAEEIEKQIKESGIEITQIPAVETDKLRKEVAQMWKEENRFKQMDPSVMESSIEDISIEDLDADTIDVAGISGTPTARSMKSRELNNYKALGKKPGDKFYDILQKIQNSDPNALRDLSDAIENFEKTDLTRNHLDFLKMVYAHYEGKLTTPQKVARDPIIEPKGRLKLWNDFLRSKGYDDVSNQGISAALLARSEPEKMNLLLDWMREGHGEIPGRTAAKRKFYQSMPDTFGKWDNELGNLTTHYLSPLSNLRSLTGYKWAVEHSTEFSDVIIRNAMEDFVRGRLNDAEALALVSSLNDLSNLSLMPQFLNEIKNKAKTFEDIALLEDWYRTLSDALLGMGKYKGKSFDFVEAHDVALRDFIADHSNLKLPESKIGTPDTEALDYVNRLYGDQSSTIRQLYAHNLLENPILRNDRIADELYVSMKESNAVANRNAEALGSKRKDYSEHFSDQFWYRLTSYMWGKPVQSIRDFNKVSRFGTEQGTIEAADKIADLIQRAHSWEARAKGEVLGPDLVQDISMKSGEFYSELFRTFAKVTNIVGAINATNNKALVDALMGKKSKIKDPKVEAAADELRSLIEKVYAYAKTETKGLATLTNESPLDLRGHGDTLLPRVWNIEYLATREGKSKLLKALSEAFSPPGKTTPVFEDSGITVEDMYNVIINSGGFVQGEWTNLKADQTRTEKDIELDLKVQEYLDSLETENLMEDGLVLDDLQAVIPRFIQKAIERTEYSKRFGKNDKHLRALIAEGIQQIRTHNQKVLKMKKGDEQLPHIDEKRFEKAAWDMSRILRNKYGYDMANMSTRMWLQRGQNIEVIAKLPLVTLASMPEFFTPMLRGDVSPHHWFMDLMAGMAWAGYKGMNGMSKLLLNKHLPAMLKRSKDIEGLGIISDVQLLRELGIADIQAMGDLVSTRYANPNFARGGLRGGAKGSLGGRVPKNIRAVFNMQTYMQATMLTTMTEMQQLMALRHFQRFASRRLKYLQSVKGKSLSARQKRLSMQYKRDLLDLGITESIDLDTSSGEATFNVGALRFVDQVITRPNDATTAKAFKNPLLAPLVLFKRFITTYGNTLITAVGNDFARTPSNIEKAKTVGQTLAVATMMYGAVMFAEVLRGALRGDLDEEDFEFIPGDFQQFMRRLDRTGLLTAPGTVAVNLAFPYKRGWWDTTQGRIAGEFLGPIGGDVFALGDALIDNKKNSWRRLTRQIVPLSKPLLNQSEEKPKRKFKLKKRSRKRKRVDLI